jgi:hypothetical protein
MVLVVQAVIVLIALMQSSGLEYVFAAVALAEYCKFWLVCLSWVNLFDWSRSP